MRGRGRHRQIQVVRTRALHDPQGLVRRVGRVRKLHREQGRLPVRADSKAQFGIRQIVQPGGPQEARTLDARLRGRGGFGGNRGGRA